MLPKNLPGFCLLFFVCWLSSCSVINRSSSYDASPIFAPFHEKAGELKVNAGYGRVLGMQSHVSYSLSNRFAVMVGGVYNHQMLQTAGILQIYGFYNPVYFKIKSHYAEGALGYYFPVNWWIFSKVEIFAGLGSGSINKKTNSEKDFTTDFYGTSGKYVKPFIVITLQKPVNDNFEIGYANRISYLRHKQLHFYYQRSPGERENFFLADEETLVTEPVLIFNYGKRLKATTQLGLAIPLAKKQETNNFYYSTPVSMIFQLGMKYSIR